MNFGQAIANMKSGGKVARVGWNGRGMWLRIVDLYADAEFRVRELEGSQGTWLPFIVIKTVNNCLVPWLASQADMLADDWEGVS